MAYAFKHLTKGSTVGSGTYVFRNYSEQSTPAVEPFLTFSSASPFTLATANTSVNWDGALEYSTDKTTWATWNGSSISSASDGTKHNIYLRGIGNTYITGEVKGKNFSFPTGSNISCSGNIENLLDYATVAQGNHPTMANDCFHRLFQYAPSLVDVSSLVLGALVLTSFCYARMFWQAGISMPPSLLATTLASHCCLYMFRGSNITNTPTLPATTLAERCYYGMFYECNALTTITSNLPATTLPYQCYYQMFYKCINLETMPAILGTVFSSESLFSLFVGCPKIKISETQSEEYVNEYRLPMVGSATTTGNNWNRFTFTDTGGTFTGDPSINTTYYTSNMVAQ